MRAETNYLSSLSPLSPFAPKRVIEPRSERGNEDDSSRWLANHDFPLRDDRKRFTFEGMFTATTHIRVRYGETDQMGYLYYGNYALYYEVGRAEAIRELGFTYRQLEEMGIMMPVAELHVQYYRPALYDDLVTVKTILKELPEGSKIQFHSELYNEQEQLLNKGVTTLVFYDPKEKKKTGMPQELYTRLEPFFRK